MGQDMRMGGKKQSRKMVKRQIAKLNGFFWGVLLLDLLPTITFIKCRRHQKHKNNENRKLKRRSSVLEATGV